ncbi:hypothetical protein B0H12DRAFT_1156215 [Mycena haematopus]|nr:hypothetical protein B0H12DRAFT_1156215 [Mycena haematopus]
MPESHLVPPAEAKAFLLNNEPPPDEHIPAIRNFIAAAREHLANFREAPENAASAAVTSQLENLIMVHTSTVSCSRRIPAEILCQIFHCISHEFTRTVGTMTVSAAPWHLAHVSKHWRATALTDAHTWSSIRIESPPVGDAHGWRSVYESSDRKEATAHPLAALETQLRLSKDVPLDVSFNWSSYLDPLPHRLELLHAVVGQCHRWQRLKVFGATVDSDVCSALLRITGHLPLLRSVETDADREVHGLSSDMQGIFATAPRLRELLLTDKAQSPLMSVPWDQITHLRASFPPDFIFRVFSQLTTLEDCEIVIDRDTPWPGRPTTPGVILPCLRRLNIQDHRLLRLVEAPTLETLEVNGNTSCIPPFLRNSACQLTRLELSACFSKPNYLIYLFRELPSLQYLYLDARSKELHLLFRAATISGSSTDLCSKLTTIVIYLFLSKVTDEHYSSLCTMIESRWNVEPCRRSLEHVRISAANPPDVVLDRFEVLEADGLLLGGLIDRDLSRRRARRAGREPGKRRKEHKSED